MAADDAASKIRTKQESFFKEEEAMANTKYPKFKAAAVRATPVYLDLDATVEKSCKFIKEAADNGAKLVSFAEGFIPGYPSFIYTRNLFECAEWYHKLYENAVEIPSPAIQKLSQCAKENKTYVCTSITEKDQGSLYLAQIWFDPEGNLIGKHRKMRCSSSERIIWGDGEGSMMPVMDTEIGRLGGLLCWEHLVPLNLAAMNGQNEQVHVASWPSNDVLPQDTEIASRYYAMATQTFVLQTAFFLDDTIKDAICRDEEERAFMSSFPYCDTCIYSPTGEVISNVVSGAEEGIAYADIDLSAVIDMKYMIDPAGHYSSKYVTMNLYCGENKFLNKIGGDGSQKPLMFDEINNVEEK